MAYIDDLLARLPDTETAEEIRKELEHLRSTKTFGLVFERHRPEHVRLPGAEIRRGGQVVFRSGQDRTVYDVVTIDGDRAKLDDGSSYHVADLADLVTVVTYGQPLYPGLTSLGSTKNGPEEDLWHAVINAENLHALEALRYTHRGKVDCIYIDPPYNTGARDWRYNNDYVDNNDAHRHSKWLAFMERRLQAAKQLLNPEASVLIVTIDEKEVHRLSLLLEQHFPNTLRQMVTTVITPNGSSRPGEFNRVDEYILFVFIGSARPNPLPYDVLGKKEEQDKEEVRWPSFLRSDSSWKREKRPNLFYPLYLDTWQQKIVGAGEPLAVEAPRESVQAPQGCELIWPIRPNGQESIWRLGRDTFLNYLSKGYIRLGGNKGGRWSIYYLSKGLVQDIEVGKIVVTGRDATGAVQVEYASGKMRFPKTVWNLSDYNAGAHGRQMVGKLLPGRSFDYPKSLYAVKDALRVAVGDKPDALILDFFAGSGTTGHAVAKLNAEDGGERRFILVTNNEVGPEQGEPLRKAGLGPGDPEWEAQGIFENITRPRIEAVITGRTSEGKPVPGAYLDGSVMADGLAGNVEFFRLDYLERDRVSLGAAFSKISPLLWLKAGATGPRVDHVSPEGWALPEGSRYGVLFEPSEVSNFLEAVQASETVREVFVVTNSQATYERIVADLPAGVEPSMLYRDYLKNFEIRLDLDDELRGGPA
ncbi:site-specific DNA-methyltransferase [Streptomyces sp. NPDC014889]|uniref:site-specific DNA-methyltransferase n=1 Tax=Streptomyces sp. NPDC014889 TaxID=3364928 RepID=UPI0036FD6CEC